ncbi:MAG: hypothetical protein M3550_03915 [Actinomycetota bacterium]|nr:hypothetical protein [Actinomycetota bacterium]
MRKVGSFSRASWLAAVITASLAVCALSACGEDDPKAANSRADEVNQAEKPCRDYRDAVTNVRFDGTLSQQAADFRAAAEAARAAATGTNKDDLVRGGGIAEDGGLRSCALLGPEPGETGVSQSGFPAMRVPEQAYPPPEEPTNDSVKYPLGNGEQLGFDRVAKLKTGTLPVDEAARTARRSGYPRARSRL